MSKPARIMVKTAFVHQAITWPTVGGSDSRTLSSVKIKGLKMWWAPQGLFMQAKEMTCIVPHANVINCILESSDSSDE